ncbi:MAG TPA: efflux RND transporter periplasmic adaptor subunit [Tepidisphaeraceae bacterium]|nr:efflux RND transporter periplasmic adaptor subunit [Tepidisphaeraceae bacterium]
MSNAPDNSTLPQQGRPRGRGVFARVLAILGVLAAIAAVVAVAIFFTDHSSGTDGASASPSVAARNVTLTAAQRNNIHLHKVAPSKFHKTVEATGTVDFDYDQATTVLAPFGGPVSRLLVSLGQHVKADEPLAMVDSPDFAAAISTYRKAIATARTARQIADLDKQLLQHRAIAQRDADQAELTAATAEADREAALQALVSLKADPRTIKDIQESKPFSPVQGVIRSPVAGTVVEKLITPGQLLVAGTTPCFTVADLSRVWVMAHLFGSELGSVSISDPAQVLTGDNRQSFSGTVDNISALVDPDTRSVAVRVAADNPGDFLKKGMYVRVRVEARQQSTGLLLPVSAVLRDEQNLPFVYLAQSDGSFARRRVTLGYRAGDQYDITEGVAAGDQVVVEGGLFVQFMENQ